MDGRHGMPDSKPSGSSGERVVCAGSVSLRYSVEPMYAPWAQVVQCR
jgi:hypothetical protein